MNDSAFDEKTLFAYENTLTYNSITEEEKQNGNICTILPNASKYEDRIYIEAGELVFDAKGKEIEWCSQVGIRVSGFYIVDGVLMSVTGVENLIDNTGTLVLPSTVKEISQGAFYNTPSLKHLIIPGTVEKINSSAFWGNTYLETVEIQNGVKKIGSRAFYGCSNLKEIIIPDSVTIIDTQAFQYCKKLENVRLSNNIENLSDAAFYGCEELSTVIIPDSVKVIGSAFGNCKKLTNIKIPKNVTSIAKDAFSYCNLLTLTVNEENETYKMIDNMLCTKDGKDVIQIMKINTLTELTIPDGVETISLQGAVKLKKLIVPASVKDLGSFYGTTELSEVEIAEDNEYYSSDEGAIYNKNKTILVRCISQEESYTVKEGVKKLAENSFHNKKKLKELIISDSVETVAGLSIYLSTNLQSLYIGKSVKNMNGHSLYYLPLLTNVTVSSENTNFKAENGMILSYDGKTLVKVLGNVTSIDVPNTIEKIGTWAFARQDKLTTVTFKEGLKEVDSGAFYQCEKLTEVFFPSTLTTISSTAFNMATALSKIVINKPKDSISGAPWSSPYGNKAINWAG